MLSKRRLAGPDAAVALAVASRRAAGASQRRLTRQPGVRDLQTCAAKRRVDHPAGPTHPRNRDLRVVAEFLRHPFGAARPPNSLTAPATASLTFLTPGSSDCCNADAKRASARTALMLRWCIIGRIVASSTVEPRLHPAAATPIRAHRAASR